MDVTTLDTYKSKGNYVNVARAREDKLLGKWFTIKEVYVDGATIFDNDGKPTDRKEDKLHLKFNEIEHVMTLNKTNFNVLVGDFGTESDDWVGEVIKLRIVPQSNGKDGVVIPSRKNLRDEGEEPPTREAKNDKDIVKTAMKESSAVKMAVGRLQDFDEEITLKRIIRELGDLKEKNDITNKAYSEALDALESK